MLQTGSKARAAAFAWALVVSCAPVAAQQPPPSYALSEGDRARIAQFLKPHVPGPLVDITGLKAARISGPAGDQVRAAGGVPVIVCGFWRHSSWLAGVQGPHAFLMTGAIVPQSGFHPTRVDGGVKPEAVTKAECAKWGVPLGGS